MEITAIFQEHNPAACTDFSLSVWQRAVPHLINQEFDGSAAPSELSTVARIIWSKEFLSFGYECAYTELDIDENPDPSVERYQLWDRDVCEAFVQAPNEPDTRLYKEFEVAPTGQWVDLYINRITIDHNWKWGSGMVTAASIDPEKRIWRAVMSIPFQAFGMVPQPGDEWAGNLFRVSRLAGERRFLAYSPTFTEKPSFHVPSKFAKLRFLE